MPVLSPPPLYFLVIDFSYTCGIHLCTFWCETDTPCHLTAHVSDQRPIIRKIPFMKRGSEFWLSSVTCFVEIIAIEQDEPGDTTSHTFQIPFPLYNHTYYWYLTGTQGGIPCKSISQIFWHQCPPPLGPTPRCKADLADWDYHDTYKCHYMSSCFQPHTGYLITSCDIHFQNSSTPTYICHDGKFGLWTANAAGQPTFQLQTAYFANPDPTPNAIVEVNVPLIPTALSPGSTYAIEFGFYDYSTTTTNKRARFLFRTGLNCEYTIPPARHVWMRSYTRLAPGRCGPLLQDWYTYSEDRNLWFKTYGTDLP